jgi:uncharacterized protein with NAD-binding domain and iron-sulfur cluster
VNGTTTREKVAVLGGGVGGMTTAFELTATPELRDRFDVTVYQLGWRLGGKGASGRNAAAGNRIEEHGLHIWFGFYDNAFRVMRDTYVELRRPAGAPLATFEEAFRGCDSVVLYDRQDGGWHAHTFHAPPNFLTAGDPGQLPTFWEIAASVCDWALGAWWRLRDDRPDLELEDPPGRFTPDWFVDLAQDVAADILRMQLRGAEHLLELAVRLSGARARQTDVAHADQAAQSWLLTTLLTGFRDWLWEYVVEDRCDDDPDLRLFFTMFDTIASSVAGVVKDGVLEHGFDAINDKEWSEWLRRHGAREVTLGRTPAERSPMLRSVYDVAFGYLDGDISKANVAAGAATNDLLRLLFSYRGSLMYKMQAGMGDTVFAPMYELLVRRGVKFEFFHAVTRLGLSTDKPLVDEIDVVPQVQLAGDRYDPLVDVERLPCWPSEPRWEQLVDGERLREAGLDFELEPNPLGRQPLRLRRGSDFDSVVLGIPVGALAPICGELIERDERFRRAIETAATVQTQAFQLWTRSTSDELGWDHDPNSVAGCYVEPLDTYCDMTHLLPRESWQEEHGVRGIAYFCGVIDERPQEAPADTRRRAKANAVEFLERDVAGLWPTAASNGAEGRFGWEVLADPAGATGPGRFDSQYWRANVTGSDRYVLTPAGSVRHRLPSDRSGFENLVLAGDWTKNGIDGGCVEAAVVSGMQAARGVIGVQNPITGESPQWLRPMPQELPPYIEYGGRATSPGPFLSLGGRMRGFLLEGDERRIGDIVRRTLSQPAGRGIDYRALGSRVLLLIGGFERVSSMAPPFDRWGTVQEIMATFWVPVVAGRDWGDVFVAERLGLACPYILVDNPMSYLGGREDYGYAKTMGRFEPSDGIADRVRVETFGGNFGRDEGAGWYPFLEVVAADDDAPAVGETLDGPVEIAAFLAGDVLQRNAEGEVVVGAVRLAARLMDDLLDGRVRQVFLKQFRDAADGNRACYQSVIEAPVEVRRSSLRPSSRRWEVKIFPLDSHPIGQEMGIASQTALLAFDGELDMVVENGIEIGRVTGAPGAPVPGAAPVAAAEVAGDGLTGLVEGAARRVYRGVAALGRLRPW